MSPEADYSDVTDHIAPSPDDRTPVEPKPTDAGPTITRERTVQETVSITAMAPEDALAEYDRLHAAWGKDPALGDDRTPEGQAFLARLEALMMRGKGLTPEENRVLLEGHGWRSREPGAQALSPAPRPVLPEGHAFDEAALVLGETEAHAMNLAPHLVMTVTDELAGMVEQEEHRGAGWGYEDGMAELTRRFGSEGAARVAANAQWALEALAASEHALIGQRVAELAEGRPNDPHLIAILGVTIYEAIRNAPPSERLAALLGRREEQLARRDATGRHAASVARATEESEADAASNDALGQIGAQHRRWQSRP